MPREEAPRLSHVGLYVTDVPKMTDFYTIEMFCDTPWYVPQPLGFEIDLDKSEDELYRETEAICRAKPGFKPMEEWRAEISRKIAAQLEA
jgi:catechol 2,3-dioxygenase-like lactoylglutathione lyase family enzyme